MCGTRFTAGCDFLVIEMGSAFDRKGENNLLTPRKQQTELIFNGRITNKINSIYIIKIFHC